jgi:hypothetical protein
VILFFVGCSLILNLIVFEIPITLLCGLLVNISRACFARISSIIRQVPYLPPKDENEDMIDAPDIYWEISFAQLVKEYKI